MLLKVDCLPNAVGKHVHTLDLSWKKMDAKLMMMMNWDIGRLNWDIGRSIGTLEGQLG